ncbi:MAG: class I SAM-dependent methyltransferase [Pseudomonadota bacterium]
MDWDEMARPWLDAAPDLEASFREIFQALFNASDLQPGETVLDVGCGTGPTLLTAAEAVGEQGRVVGIDVAPPLLARASERVPDSVELITGDAGAYPYDPGAFDAIIANFGIMFFDDNDRAFANLRRAVKPGGRLTATVWATPPENPWFSMPRRIVDGMIADVPRPDPTGPGPMRFGDPAGLTTILQNSGWTPSIKTLDLMLHPPGPAEQVAELHMKVTVGMMLKGVEVDEPTVDQVRAAVVDACKAYQTDDGIQVPAKIHLVEAVAA